MYVTQKTYDAGCKAGTELGRPREEEAGPMKNRTKQDYATDAVAMVADVL